MLGHLADAGRHHHADQDGRALSRGRLDLQVGADQRRALLHSNQSIPPPLLVAARVGEPHAVVLHNEQHAVGPPLENHLDALLNPDYTDEEIRREVRNFGVDKADDGKLVLEEKGTVYNEMVRTIEAPETNLWRAAGYMVYGTKHPLSLDSGGLPDAIREMTPKDIRTFHAAAYHLANMGMIGALPS